MNSLFKTIHKIVVKYIFGVLMENGENLKSIVREKYAAIAEQSKTENATSCCGVGGCSTIDYSIMSDDYSATDGYVPEADLGLGCGIPTEFAQIQKGNTVLDLGSGAGNDCFVARALVGSSGKVIGVDMTDAMIEKARVNVEKLGFNNVEFRHGDIEKLPVAGETIDVVISNCVLNLVPDKKRAFSEMFRVLKKGGHFSVSDIVLNGTLPDSIRTAAEMYAGCVSGAIQKDEYLHLLKQVGFSDVTVQKEKVINLPDEILLQYMNKDEIAEFRKSGNSLSSVTVYGKKAEACCSGDCCN